MKISISIDVASLETATDFYTNALGCTKVREQEPKMVVLNAGNADIYLQEKKEGTNPLSKGDAARSYKRHWTPVHMDFLIDDVEKTVEEIVKQGGTHEGGEKGDWGEIAYCADPFGNGFCVIRE